MTTRAVTLAGRDIPAGAIIMVSIPLAHHRAAAYPEPEAFRPERFLGHRPGPSEWVPFGGGRRRCLPGTGGLPAGTLPGASAGTQ